MSRRPRDHATAVVRVVCERHLHPPVGRWRSSRHQREIALLDRARAERLFDFNYRHDVTIQGTLDGKPWSFTPSNGTKALQMKQYLRVEGMVDHPAGAVVKTVQVRVLDASGGVKATQSAKL